MENEAEQKTLPNGISYKEFSKNKISLTIDLKVINLKNALKSLLDIFEVKDINVFDVDLETVIREIYAKSK